MFTTKNLFTHFGKHILIALAVVTISFSVILFVSGKITKMATETATNRHLAATLSERTSLLSNLKHETDIIGPNDKILKQAFIPSNNILEFVAILKSLALKNGITQSLNFSSPTPTSLGTTFPLATISYQNTISSANVSIFINYLKDFEKLPYFTKINSLNISSGSADWRSTSNISYSATVAVQTIE
ncbi:MAG TPA: hypothetical protein DCZ83_03230 [Candidatus Yonathbacteria bacterium]|nr:hypothetical protein [Candidatus Yonathbacteria bacterium]